MTQTKHNLGSFESVILHQNMYVLLQHRWE